MSTPTLAMVGVETHQAQGVGKELIVELWDPAGVDLIDTERIKAVLLRAAKISGSTVIRSYFHRLHPGGITGFLLLKESHISIHTWPEYGYAALDFFTCGKADSYKALEHVEKEFRPTRVSVSEVVRGIREPG